MGRPLTATRLSLLLALLVALGSGTALAAPLARADVVASDEALEIWTPLPTAPRAIPAGPVEVHVVRRSGERLVPVADVVVRADVGEVEALAPVDDFVARALFVPPPAHRGPVVLTASPRAQDDRARPGRIALALDDRAMPDVEVTLAAPSLTKGKGDDHVDVRIRTLDASGRPSGDVAPRLFTNTGSVTTPVMRGPGVFHARYTTSGKPYPEVAVLVALLPYPHEASAAASVGHAVLKLPAAIELPGDTKPGVLMTVQIGDERFGPVRADARGRFRVPVVVPPGVGVGVGISQDSLGNAKRTRVDLRLPPTKRLAIASHPRELVADGNARALVVLTALSARGDPHEGAAPRARARRGELGPLVEVGPGLYQAWYRAPLGVTEADDGSTPGDLIEAELPGDRASRTSLPVRLLAGPPVSLTLAPSATVVEAPASAPLPIAFSLVDALGNPVDDALVRAEARHGAVVMDREGAARARRLLYLAPGSSRPAVDPVVVRAIGRAHGDAVRLAFSPPSTLVAVDALGRPVPGAAVRSEGRVVLADAEGRVLLPASSGVIVVQLPGSVLPTLLHLGLGSDGKLHGAPTSPPAAEQKLELTLAPPHDVTVEAEAAAREGGRVEVRYVVKGATSGKVRVFVDDRLAAETDVTAGAAWVPASDGAWVTVTHVPSGIGAAFQVGGATVTPWGR